MTVYLSDPDFTLHHGDARDVLPTLPADSVDCVLTSPPFYGLRDYGVDGQIGLEASPGEWVDDLVDVFRDVRRVLRTRGTLWVECGTSYVSNASGSMVGATLMKGGRQTLHSRAAFSAHRAARNQDSDTSGTACMEYIRALKTKDLILQPFILAMALVEDDWWLRQIIVWHKPNVMPESVTDRCTTAHSYLLLLSKSARYFFDSAAIAEPAEWARWGDQTVPKYQGTDTASGWIKPRTKEELTAFGNRRTNDRLEQTDGRRNPRSVWSIPTLGYSGAHFATWPEQLVERIILAGCPEGGTVLDPFIGSGTSALVARRLNRRAIGVELNSDYCRLAAERTRQLSLLA